MVYSKLVTLSAAAFSTLLLLGEPAAENIAYLSTGGDDAEAEVNDRYRPFKSLAVAIAALGAEGGTVSVAGGVYTLDSAEEPADLQGSIYTKGASCIRIATPVKVVGATGNPLDVTFKRGSDAGYARVFMLDHAEAALRFLTIENGYFKDVICNGGNVLVGYNGGTVEDCILSGGNAGNQNSTEVGGGNIALMNGRCSRCQITGGVLGHYRPIGLNVMAAGSSVVENCLITKGRCTSAHEAAADEGAVALKDSAKLVNCTVVANTANRFSGVNILSKNARAVNCLIFGNTVTYEKDSRESQNDTSANGVSKNANNLDCYVNCGSDLDTTRYPQLNDTCFTVTAEDFADPENERWWLDVNCKVRDAGGDYTTSGAVSETDLAGATRVQGVSVEPGCYELSPAFHFSSVTVGSQLYIFATGGVTATFSAEAVDATGTIVYTWDFGDGSESLVTTDNLVQHLYSRTGSFYVRVTAACGDEEPVVYEFADPVDVMNFSVNVSRSAERVCQGLPVTFTAATIASGSVSYSWNFGDGTDRVVTDSPTVEHAYAEPGRYSVSLYADGGSDGSMTVDFESELLVVAKDIYVDVTSSAGEFPYASPATAAKALQDVKDFFADGQTVHLAPGEYKTENWCVSITNALTFVGEGASPADVVLYNGYANFNNGTRNMSVAAEGAFVANLTLKGGYANYAPGGNLNLSAGVVSNCVLTTGGSNSSGGSGGAAYVTGGLLTHCVITNSYLGNRGDGITVCQKGGRVSNCLITGNRRSWSGSRNAFSLYYADGGIVDNCTIADCWICKYNPNNVLQMKGSSDSGVKIQGTAKAYNLLVADIRWDIVPGAGEDRDALLAELTPPRRWAGTAANFVNCATDDAAAINGTCRVGTLEWESLFVDYAGGDLTPGAAAKHKGAVIDGVAFPRTDLAGNPRLFKQIDIGCYERQMARGLRLRLR